MLLMNVQIHIIDIDYFSILRFTQFGNDSVMTSSLIEEFVLFKYIAINFNWIVSIFDLINIIEFGQC